MKWLHLRDKQKIEQFLRKDVYLHIYGLGDLDDFFWPHTTWFGCQSGGELGAVVLVYKGQSLPTVLALSREREVQTISWLLHSIAHLLPRRFYAHLSPGLADQFRTSHQAVTHGPHSKMALLNDDLLFQKDSSGVVRLSTRDRKLTEAFYLETYPGNWFDPRMLETKQYFGILEAGRLVSVAGIHVYSPYYGVAALGNIATLPTHRRKGLASRVTARLCQSLKRQGMQIGLNVATDNKPALSCYRKLGFETVTSYEEILLEKKAAVSSH